MIFVKLVRRFCLPSSQPVMLRYLSEAQTATALRPFFFAVHPDFFTRHPEARDRNEDSLKRLNQYLNDIHIQRPTASFRKNIHLIFYLREASHVPGIRPQYRPVEMFLSSSCARETVITVLKTCDLPLDYVHSIRSTPKQNVSVTPGFKVKWDKTFYEFYGVPNPDQMATKSVQTLSSWLKKNQKKALEMQKSQEAVQKSNEDLISKIINLTGLKHIKWASRWGVSQFRASLNVLLGLVEQYGDELDLKGFGLTFGKRNDVSACGDIVLACDDVANHWLQVLKSANQYLQVIEDLNRHEQELTQLLKNAKIVRPAQSSESATLYAHELDLMTSSIKKYLATNPEALEEMSLGDVEILLVGRGEQRGLNNKGQIMLPYSCAADLHLQFLNDNASRARSLRYQHIQQQRAIEVLVETCRVELELTSLTCDSALSPSQLEHCCRKLLSTDPTVIGVSLTGCQMQVAQFYSVMASGQLCIPWNFRATVDEE